jgi:hypothetical protein
VTAPGWILLIAGLVLAAGLLTLVGYYTVLILRQRQRESHDRKVAAIENDLELKSQEMRSAIFELASALSMDGHQARKDMIREAYLASGNVEDPS